MSKEKQFPIDYNGISCDSIDEVSFLHWAFELKESGYISFIERAPTYELSPTFKTSYSKPLKTKNLITNQLILREHVYTPEFKIEWSDKASGVFYQNLSTGTKIVGPFLSHPVFTPTGIRSQSLVEIKPSFDQQNMERLFKINQKWLFHQKALYVNLVKVNILFKETFTPDKYLLTEKTKKLKKINWEVRTLEQFLNL